MAVTIEIPDRHSEGSGPEVYARSNVEPCRGAAINGVRHRCKGDCKGEGAN